MHSQVGPGLSAGKNCCHDGVGQGVATGQDGLGSGWPTGHG